MSRLIVLLCAVCGLWAADTPRIRYSKSFPGSTPAYVAITVDKNGSVQYTDAPDDQNPLTCQLAAQDAAEIFSLAEKLSYFTRPLESNLKVAFMGTKTFRYENGSQKSEVKFNFSEDPLARNLADWFERISESEQHRINLERSAKYDKLGVLNALLQFEVSLDRKRIVAADQFLPMLDRIAKGETYLHAARERAASMADAIRKGAAQQPAAAGSPDAGHTRP